MLLNPTSMKQALVESATRLSGPSIFEQGAGNLNLYAAYTILRDYVPRVSIWPRFLSPAPRISLEAFRAEK